MNYYALSRERRFESCRKVLVLSLSTVDGGVKLEGTIGVSWLLRMNIKYTH
jgi:hypothetical protein